MKITRGFQYLDMDFIDPATGERGAPQTITTINHRYNTVGFPGVRMDRDEFVAGLKEVDGVWQYTRRSFLERKQSAEAQIIEQGRRYLADRGELA